MTSGNSDGSEIVRRSVTTPGVGVNELTPDEPVIVLVRVPRGAVKVMP
jgi:hypothetical protein